MPFGGEEWKEKLQVGLLQPASVSSVRTDELSSPSYTDEQFSSLTRLFYSQIYGRWKNNENIDAPADFEPVDIMQRTAFSHQVQRNEMIL